MSLLFRPIVALVLLTCAVPGAHAADGAVEERRYVIPFRGTIVLDVPTAWVDRVERASSNAPPTMRFEPESGDGFTIALAVAWGVDGDGSFNESEALRGMVENAVESLRDTAKETEIPIREIRERSVQGYYFTITDKVEDLPPGEYRYLTQGALSLDDLLISFSILTQPETRSVADRALDMIRGLSRPSGRSGGG